MSAPTSPAAERMPLPTSNRLGLDYAAEAKRFRSLPKPIIDVHSHIGGMDAARIYKRAAELYGVGLTYSMSQLEQVPALREIFGDRIQFIAVPNFRGRDRKHEFTDGFMERIEKFAALGARIVKFWSAPRASDIGREFGEPAIMRLDSPRTIAAMELASSLGMMFMTHVSDPDTWFEAKYTDATLYGTKRAQYVPLEKMLDRFTRPWIAAHMAGWPEDIAFLSGLLERHPNLYLDCSACKWMVRELSRYSREELIDFLRRWRGRILFGSDIVTSDEHLIPAADEFGMAQKANTPTEAFELYASRYWAYRTMFETRYDGESPIADPDLAMVAPERYRVDDAPRLRGHDLPEDVLIDLYHDAAAGLFDKSTDQ